jgi:hypothetical protein
MVKSGFADSRFTIYDLRFTKTKLPALVAGGRVAHIRAQARARVAPIVQRGAFSNDALIVVKAFRNLPS